VHPFFASIHWNRLWDDPAPPLEMGLIRCEAAPVDEWDDISATWDKLVSGSEAEDEKMGAWRNYIRIRIHTVMSTDMCTYGCQETMISYGRLTCRRSCHRWLYHLKRSVRMARFRVMHPRRSVSIGQCCGRSGRCWWQQRRSACSGCCCRRHRRKWFSRPREL
jgi:hypothetical protein